MRGNMQLRRAAILLAFPAALLMAQEAGSTGTGTVSCEMGDAEFDLPEVLRMASLLILFSLLCCGMVLVIHGSFTKNRWEINPDKVSCPRCKTPMPTLRTPKTVQQRLWGGGTCSTCGTEVDKWGRDLSPQITQEQER
jgi:hypothetical protein